MTHAYSTFESASRAAAAWAPSQHAAQAKQTSSAPSHVVADVGTSSQVRPRRTVGTGVTVGGNDSVGLKDG